MRRQLRPIAFVAIVAMSSFLVFGKDKDAAENDQNDGQAKLAAGTVVPVLRFEKDVPVEFEFDFVNNSDELFRHARSHRGGIQHLFFVVYRDGRRLPPVVVETQPFFVEGLLKPGARLTHTIDIEQHVGHLEPGRYEVHATYDMPPDNGYKLTPLKMDKTLLHFVIE